jgi:hypothetical protein
MTALLLIVAEGPRKLKDSMLEVYEFEFGN